MSCSVSLKLSVPFQLDVAEIVGVVGNANSLGLWNLNRSLIMIPSDTSNGEWNIKFNLPELKPIRYRYFIGRVISDSSNSKKILVHSWETHLQPRTFLPSGLTCIINDGRFGIITGSEHKVVSKGWLTEQHEYRFSISQPKNSPFLEIIEDLGATQASTNIGCFHVQPEASSVSLSSSLIKITPFNFTILKDKKVKCFKIPTSDDIHYMFTIQSLKPSNEFVRFHIFTENGNHFGIGFISCLSLTNSKGICKVPVVDKNQCVVALLRVPFLHIKPFRSNLLMEHSFSSYWKKQPMVHVGHRGSGNSFTSENLADVWENTVASLNKASSHGARFIEFDVHLSKDHIPIIYHDLTTCIAAAEKKMPSKLKLIEFPVYLFNLNDLRSLKLKHKSRATGSRKLAFDEELLSPLHQPFPTLEEVLKEVSLYTGFNIEIKWPYLDEDKNYENNLEHYFDANQFIDTILKVVFESAGPRKIIFSCFDVDICIMLNRKQNRYPVLFLTNGDTLHYKPMLDLRESTNRMAIGTAMAEDFLGINSLVKDVYKNPDIVKKAHNAGLVFACYGDDVGDNLKQLENASVDIAIYDRIYENKYLTTKNGI